MVGLVGLVGSTTKKLHRPLLSERTDNVVHGDTTCLFFSLFALFHAGQTQHRGLTGCSTHSTVPNKVLR